MSQTIAAIATANSAGGIGIVRISGDTALDVADSIFTAKNNTKLCDSPGYRAYYGHVYDKDVLVDEVIAIVYKAPKSYTGENVVELSGHGGLLIMRHILRLCLENGAAPAGPGDFTKRAFLNGRIDLAKAESVMSLINAHSEQAAEAALSSLDGKLSEKTEKISSVFISACAGMSAWVDYPDEEIAELSRDTLIADFEKAKNDLQKLIVSFDAGQAVTQGVNTAIIGRPNVGKSTLMNLLLGKERSIVTDIAGTTRDVIEETAMVGNVTLRLCDTAGLHDSDDPVETLGIQMAKNKIRESALIVAVFDASSELCEEDKTLLSLCSDKKSIAVINKSDLDSKINTGFISKNTDRIVYTCASTGEGYDDFVNAVESVLGTSDIDTSFGMLLTERQLSACKKALECADEAISGLKNGITLDAVNVSCEACIDALSEITGKNVSDAVLDKIFSEFCVGK